MAARSAKYNRLRRTVCQSVSKDSTLNARTDVRVEDRLGPAVRRDDERGQVIGHRRVMRRSAEAVSCASSQARRTRWRMQPCLCECQRAHHGRVSNPRPEPGHRSSGWPRDSPGSTAMAQRRFEQPVEHASGALPRSRTRWRTGSLVAEPAERAEASGVDRGPSEQQAESGNDVGSERSGGRANEESGRET